MGEGFQFIDIILLAMVAGFIALRLRSVLGRRTGEEQSQVEGLSRRMGTAHPGDTGVAEDVTGPSETVIRLEADPVLRKVFREMRRIEPHLDVDAFLDGARSVYPMVLNAFWQGDRKTLDQFLSPDVKADFLAAIEEREAAGHVVEGQVIELGDSRIVEAALSGDVAAITVRFEAEVVSVTRNADGEIIDGNVSDTVTVHDIWTFERILNSDDPAWLLVATRND